MLAPAYDSHSELLHRCPTGAVANEEATTPDGQRGSDNYTKTATVQLFPGTELHQNGNGVARRPLVPTRPAPGFKTGHRTHTDHRTRGRWQCGQWCRLPTVRVVMVRVVVRVVVRVGGWCRWCRPATAQRDGSSGQYLAFSPQMAASYAGRQRFLAAATTLRAAVSGAGRQHFRNTRHTTPSSVAGR